MTSRETLAAALLTAPVLTAALLALAPRRLVAGIATLGGLVTGGLAVALATLALADSDSPSVGTWLVVDAAGGLLVGVIGVVGVGSVLVSPAYLETASGSVVSAERRERVYYLALYCFWAILLVGLVALYLLGLVSGGLGGVEGFIASLGFTGFRFTILPFIVAMMAFALLASVLLAIIGGVTVLLYNALQPLIGGVEVRSDDR